MDGVLNVIGGREVPARSGATLPNWEPATGDPLSATYRNLRSGLTVMPRGRLPSGIVASAVFLVPSMIVRSPEASLVT